MSDRELFYDRRRNDLVESDPAVPFDFAALERAAEEALPAEIYRYVSGASGTGATLRANEAGFDRWQIVPRVFRGSVDPDLTVDLFGETYRAPVALAPIGGQSAYHDAGELASARAAATLGVPFSLSTAASNTIEDVAREAADAAGDDCAPQFFQLYWTADWEVTASLLERAEAAGYDAILLTVDFQGPRWIPGILVDAPDRGAPANANLVEDPVVQRKGLEPTGTDVWEPSVTWSDLDFLREHTDLPIVIKGIVHPDDARLAIEHGADGVVVSNHGGRQVDGAVGTITALPRVVEAIDGQIPVLFDGGVRGGADVFKALAIGADMVCLGRPYIYGLAVAGERGVREVALNVLAELESVLALSGHRDVGTIDRSALLDAAE